MSNVIQFKGADLMGPKNETAAERKKRMQKIYNRRYYQKQKRARKMVAQELGSKRMPKKARNASRNKKRRGLPTVPVKRNKERAQAQSVLAARTHEAISLLREATRTTCSCGQLIPKMTKRELLVALAQLELEQG